MSWTRYDDELPMNRKTAWLRVHGVEGIAALGMHMLANTWSRHEGQQGFIPYYMPEQLAGRCGPKLADLLADPAIGMFEPVDNGWMIHDYDDFGDRDDGVPVEEKKARLSKVRAEAGRIGGKAKASNGRSKRPSKSLAKPQQSSSPVPGPVPEPSSSSVSYLGEGSVPRTAKELSPYCSKHPNGTEESCGPCGTSRRRYDAAVEDAELDARMAAAAELIARQTCTDCNAAGQTEDADGNLGARCKHPNLTTRSLGETA